MAKTPKRLKVPRASLAVTMLDDPEFIALCQTPEGREAVALFCSLLMAAKTQENDGRFDGPEAVVAMLVRWPLASFQSALDALSGKTDWLSVQGDGSFTIRSFKKWNSWGGKRESSGAPNGNQNASKIQSRNNQVAEQDSIKLGQTVSVSDSVTDSKDKLPASDKPKRTVREKINPTTATIPDDLGKYEDAIRQFVAWRDETLRKPVYAGSWDKFLDGCRKLGVQLQDAIDQSMANGWQGLFAPKRGAFVQQEDKSW